MTLARLLDRRGGFVALLCGVALATAVATGLVDAGHHAAASAAHPATIHTQGHTHDHSDSRSGAPTARVAFHDEMRKLWEDHVAWTRLAIVTFADGSAGFEATAARLMQNQTDIGDLVKPYYGAAAGNRLTDLLEDHIGIAVGIMQAARAGDDAAFREAKADWYTNGDDIADFLAAANPRYWPRDTMRAAMRGHLDQTLAEASHELAGDYAASVADYDEIHHHILGMADVLSSGIVRAFPGQFR
jgi:hypothetical protein